MNLVHKMWAKMFIVSQIFVTVNSQVIGFILHINRKAEI